MTDELAPHWLQVARPASGAPGLTVDTLSLREVADGLQADLDRSQTGPVQVIKEKIDQAVSVEVVAVEDVRAARAALRCHLNETLTGLREHVLAASRLAQLAAQISARYHDNDVYSSARLADVTSLMPTDDLRWVVR